MAEMVISIPDEYLKPGTFHKIRITKDLANLAIPVRTKDTDLMVTSDSRNSVELGKIYGVQADGPDGLILKDMEKSTPISIGPYDCPANTEVPIENRSRHKFAHIEVFEELPNNTYAKLHNGSSISITQETDWVKIKSVKSIKVFIVFY